MGIQITPSILNADFANLGAEIGRILGVSESRVSQLLSSVRRTLKERMDAYDQGTGGLRKAA